MVCCYVYISKANDNYKIVFNPCKSNLFIPGDATRIAASSPASSPDSLALHTKP